MTVASVTAQGIEQHIGVNCLAPFLSAQLLLPQSREAAKIASPGSVRINWTTSWTVDSQAPKGGIIDFESLAKGSKDAFKNYALSKCGNWMLATEGARRYGDEKIMSLMQNPGYLDANVWQYVPKAGDDFS